MRHQLTVHSAVVLCCFVSAPSVGAQPAVPKGWSSRTVGADRVYTPAALAANDLLSVTFLRPRAGGTDASVPAVDANVDADLQGLSATVVRRGATRTGPDGIVSATRVIRTARSGQLIAIYVLGTGSGTSPQLVRVLASSPALLLRHQADTEALVHGGGWSAVPTGGALGASAPVASETRVAPAPRVPTAGRASPGTAGDALEDVSRVSSDVVVRTAAPRRSKVLAGGRLMPGMYVGQQVESDTRKVVGELTLWLYGSGEFRQIWKGRPNDAREDDFAYDPATGRIDLSYGSLMNIQNSRIAPNVDFAVFGRTLDGTPLIYAENDRGFHTVVTVLAYAGPNDRASPTAMQAAAAAAEAEAARYKHVVAAGQGVQDAQIAGIVMHSELHRTMGLSMQQGVSTTLSLYLMLTDGTIHDGLPVPPDELDVSTSRRREPQTWGRWRRSGAGVEVEWKVTPGVWKPLEGEAMVKPRATDVLRGRFSGGESQAGGDVGSFSLYGVSFGAAQRFETDSRGGTGTGGFTQTMSGTSVQTTRDDEGSVTSATTPGAVVSSERRARDGARVGTYRITGWNLEARYDDGRVVRQPFFFLDEKRDAIYWQGKVVSLSTDR